MINFEFSNTTEVISDRDTQKQVGEKIRRYSSCTKVLLVYGSDRIKRDGLFDAVCGSLEEQGVGVPELGGMKPNPRLGLVCQGIDIRRKENISFILAVGGDNAIGTAKVIGVGVPYEGDVWDFHLGKKVSEKIPRTAAVCTILAARSKASLSSISTDEDGWYKKGINLDLTRSVFSIINPELTFTFPAYQVGCGAVDMMIHITERYFTNITYVDLTDRFCEAALRGTIANEVRALKEPYNYDTRAEIVWADTLAHNGLLNTGRVQDWASHRIALEIDGKYDTAHGTSLSIVYPVWMEYVYSHDKKRLMQFAARVWDVGLAYREEGAICLEGIRRTREFFKWLDMPITFEDAGFPADALEETADKATYGDTIPVGNFVKIGKSQMIDTYRLCTKEGAL